MFALTSCIRPGLIFLCLILGQFVLKAQPLDDIVERKIVKERLPLKRPPIREADLFWEKRIWRVIDTREKMNLAFRYPKAPFIEILLKEAEKGNITLYGAENDEFLEVISQGDLDGILYERDTVPVLNPETEEVTYQEIINDLDLESIVRFRVREHWYFDLERGELKVQILGIAPLRSVYSDNGDFRFEIPMFWVHYPEARQVLAEYPVFNGLNEGSDISWEDLFEMRYFASYIYKEGNVFDQRLEDYLSGTDLLLESQKINQAIFDFEHELWSY